MDEVNYDATEDEIGTITTLLSLVTLYVETDDGFDQD